MNFLKMAQEVRHLSGVQGTGPSSVVTTGYDQIFLSIVRYVWKDIQASKKTWKWMRASSTLLTVIDQTGYLVASVFGPVNRFKSYITDTFYILIDGKKTPLRYMNYEMFTRIYVNTIIAARPGVFTIRPSDNAIIIPKPDAVYSIYFDYRKNAQSLELAADIPECQEDYHKTIVYGAVASYCLSIGLSHLQQEYSQRFTEGYDQMVREQIPQEYFKVRGVV